MGKAWSAEVTGNVGGPYLWGGSWRISPIGGLDVGVKKQLWNNRADLKIIFTDIFLTNPWHATSNFGGMQIQAYGTQDSRKARAVFTYRLGRNKNSEGKERHTGLGAEEERLNKKNEVGGKGTSRVIGGV